MQFQYSVDDVVDESAAKYVKENFFLVISIKFSEKEQNYPLNVKFIDLVIFVSITFSYFIKEKRSNMLLNF